MGRTPMDTEAGDEDPNDEPRGYSSPACFAHEVDPNYFLAPPPLEGAELVALLNTLLEAERAGVRTVADQLRDLPEGEVREALEQVLRDEGRYVALLRGLVLRLGAEPSSATGGFHERARAVTGTAARLEFLNRGQAWVVRRLDEALPRLRQPWLREPLEEMRRRHVENIRRCGG